MTYDMMTCIMHERMSDIIAYSVIARVILILGPSDTAARTHTCVDGYTAILAVRIN
jgi:hypothetical protein